ncbi:type III-B CRISPR module-associated protein Cmr5 [Bacteroidetes/Chlorobi group bacterium Naka2016]|jgi:CRISPR-associated protein Cmr5|nr:MAG: type III-B CRISPR module-associated protein Cmr5 [Bacteroidetes/Chlorobi group bacterium Naka2016]
MSTKETLITKLENGRAEFAYKCAEEAIKRLNEKRKKEYRSYTRKIPMMVLSNGLGQTLVFIKAKSNDGNVYELIYDQITRYFKESYAPSRVKMPSNENELIKWVISCDSTTYRYITQDLLAFLNWLRRFAEGMIEPEEGGQE